MNDFLLLGGVVTGLAVSGLIGFLIGDRSGNGGAGLFLALVLGPLGWLIAALVLKEKPREMVARAAVPRRPLIDDVEAWERKEHGTPLPPAPDHLKGRKIED
jgi:hypothetical protein